MKFLGKVFSFLVLIFAIYMLGIFFMPSLTDSIGKELGILDFNVWVRQLKGGADSVSEDLLQVNQAADVLSGARSVVDKTKDIIQKTQDGIETTRQVIDTKVQQVNKVADSFEKTKKSVDELQSNLTELTSMGTGSNTSSGTSTGSSSK